jgi:hypothetical protein
MDYFKEREKCFKAFEVDYERENKGVEKYCLENLC